MISSAEPSMKRGVKAERSTVGGIFGTESPLVGLAQDGGHEWARWASRGGEGAVRELRENLLSTLLESRQRPVSMVIEGGEREV